MALGDARQLQVQQQRKLEAVDKQIRPPMVGPPSLKNEPASLLLFSTVRSAQKSSHHAVVSIGGQVIQYVPDLPGTIQGMTGGKDFLIGPSGFVSDLESARTIAHELYRLRMEQTGYAEKDHNADAHEAARAFANRAGPFIMEPK